MLANTKHSAQAIHRNWEVVRRVSVTGSVLQGHKAYRLLGAIHLERDMHSAATHQVPADRSAVLPQRLLHKLSISRHDAINRHNIT